MKKTITRLVLLCTLLGLSFTGTVSAQRYHSRPIPRRHYHGDGFLRALDAAEHVGRAALFGAFLHGLDDYTGFRVGYNAASLRTDLKHSDVTSEFTSGVNVGFVFGWHLGHTPLILEPGIYYSMKGGKLKGRFNDGAYYNTDISMHNVEIPLVLKAHMPLTPDNYVSMQPFFGGFLSFGFAGTTKYEENFDRIDSHGNYIENPDKYDTYGDDLFCTTDAGLRMGVGFNVGQAYLEFAYDLGLVNLPNSRYGLMDFDDYSDSMRSNTLSFSVGFNF